MACPRAGIRRARAATLIAGAEGDGATIFAERLTLKFAGAEGERWNLQNCPDILAVRPELPKSKPDDEKTHYGVDSVRGGDEGGDEFGVGKTRRVGIVEFAGMRPKALPCRVVLIRRADRMNSQAANALLKTLEEPGRTTRFILTAPAARLLLPTVASRCRVLPLPRPSAEQAAAWALAAGRDSADLAFFANRPLDAADEDRKVRDLRREAIGLFRAGKDLDTIAGIKALSGVPPAQWLEWLQKWTADAARTAMNLPPQFFPNEAGALSRLAKRTRAGVFGLARRFGSPADADAAVERGAAGGGRAGRLSRSGGGALCGGLFRLGVLENGGE